MYDGQVPRSKSAKHAIVAKVLPPGRGNGLSPFDAILATVWPVEARCCGKELCLSRGRGIRPRRGPHPQTATRFRSTVILCSSLLENDTASETWQEPGRAEGGCGRPPPGRRLCTTSPQPWASISVCILRRACRYTLRSSLGCETIQQGHAVLRHLPFSFL